MRVTVLANGSPAGTMASGIGRWLLMIVAMMLPLILGPIRTTAARSLWRRRHRAIGAFLGGYLLPWLLGGVALAVLAMLMPAPQTDRSSAPLMLAFAVAAGWQLTPVKRRALVSCHATRPLAPRGWPASRDCLIYGWIVGVRCVIT